MTGRPWHPLDDFFRNPDSGAPSDVLAVEADPALYFEPWFAHAVSRPPVVAEPLYLLFADGAGEQGRLPLDTLPLAREDT